MSDYGGDDMDYDENGNGDWIYVEEYYDEVDELAETTCPDPAYYEEGRYDDHDDDMYDYFADLEYLSDGGYFDEKDPDAALSGKRVTSSKNTTTLRKRRRKVLHSTSQTKSTFRPVVWITETQRRAATENQGPPVREVGKKVGILKDWRERFEDQVGLAQFPKDDFELRDSEESSVYDTADVERGAEAGEGFDLSDMQQITQLLSGENMEALQAMMEAKGLDPVAVQEVLRDMMEGRERHLDDEDADSSHMADDETDCDEETGDEEMSRSATGKMPVPPFRQIASQATQSIIEGSSTGSPPTGTPSASEFLSNGHAAHGTLKRKAREMNDEPVTNTNGNTKPKETKRQRTAWKP